MAWVLVASSDVYVHDRIASRSLDWILTERELWNLEERERGKEVEG